MEIIQNAAIIIAVVDAIKRVVPANVQGITTIVVAGVVGLALAAVQGDTGLIDGVFNGLIAVGAVTTAGRVGK